MGTHTGSELVRHYLEFDLGNFTIVDRRITKILNTKFGNKFGFFYGSNYFYWYCVW